MGLKNKYNSYVAFGLPSLLPFPPSPPQFLLLFDFIFCGKIQHSAFSLLVNFYEDLADCSWLNACTVNGWAVSMNTRPLLRFHMSHLTKDHYLEMSVILAKVWVCH